MVVISVISKTRSVIGEGPIWDHRINRLIYVDIFSHYISRLNPETQEEEIIKLDGDLVSLAIPFENDPNKYIIARNKQLCILDWNTQQVSVCAEVDSGLKTRFNDGKCDSKGRLWAGTMALETAPFVFGEDNGSIYSLCEKNCVKTHDGGMRISNGLAWDKANKKMYFVDSLPLKIYVYDYDVDSGIISNRKVLVDFGSDKKFAEFGLPDGMTIDAEDKLWVACFNGGRILRIDTNTGKILQTLRFPCTKITSCTWGGPNYDILYVTSGKMDLSDQEMKNQPTAGAVFKVEGLGVQGVPPVFYKN